MNTKICFLSRVVLLLFLAWGSMREGAAQQPALGASLFRGGVRIEWPIEATGYILQSTADLKGPKWLDVADTPQREGTKFFVVVQFGRGNQFFRLINREPPTSLPVLKVAAGASLSTGQFEDLTKLLGLKGAQMDERGLVFFIDPERFQAVPTTPISDPVILRGLQIPNEEKAAPDLFQGFDLAKLKEIKPVAPEVAMSRATEALAKSGLLPADAQATVGHTRLSILDTKGNAQMEDVMLDTQVSFDLFANGVPLVGPGARIAVTFEPGGAVSQLLYAHPKFEKGGEVPVLPEKTVLERAAKLFPAGARLTQPRLVYFCPSLLKGKPGAILPYYEVGGTIESRVGEPVETLRRMIPATDSPEVVPVVQLEGTLLRGVVTATATVRGGVAPYQFQWVSSSTDLGDRPVERNQIQYTVNTREARGTEHLEVLVTDANGVEASAFVDLGIVLASPITRTGGSLHAMIGGVTDFGVERGVSDMGSGIQNGFVNQFKKKAEKRFSFGGNAWERDFKEGANGLDSQYVDNADLVLYIGHGSPGQFTFDTSQSDTSIVPGDVTSAWGNGDLEWLCLVSCQVLKWSSGGQNVVQRWGGAFNGLHMLLGFDTNAHDWSDFGFTFAYYAQGFDVFPGFRIPAVPVRKAWFLAKRDAQPSGNVAGAMGPIGPGGVTNCNEYFWGQGPTGPDISKANIQGWWVLYYQ